MKLLLVILLFAYYSRCDILTRINFTEIISAGKRIFYSGIGLTYDLPDLIPYLNSSLFKGYLRNAEINKDSLYFFWQHIHVPLGYKYGCSSSYFGGQGVNCTLDISFDYTLLDNLNYFFYDLGQPSSSNLGWDIQKANFSRTSYRSNFANYYLGFWGNYVNAELIDRGDKITNYTTTTFLSDIAKIYSATYGIVQIYAPGLTEDQTSNNWWNIISSMASYNGVFSLRCVIFKNISEVTISNLMNDTYVDGYITKRLTQPNGNYNDPNNNYIALTDVRLTNTTGVDGVTNSFAAALWAFDFSLKFMQIGGYFASFYSPFNSSNQSVLGEGPLFGPQALYYGLLFANLATSDQVYFITPNVTAVSSKLIKIYAFAVYDGFRLVIINKDQNVSLNGTVDIALDFNGRLNCVYMQADSLSSTTGITIGNVSFIANNSDFVGAYTTFNYVPDDNGVFHVNIRYAQAAICKQIPKETFNYFTRKDSLSSWQKNVLLGVLGLLAVFLA